ncbi:hypothetical protein ZWY2020_046324 [Hordeum vulgare]|nr:hypothetical protein ZWY2020_046324 [Hordeum vulgare]
MSIVVTKSSSVAVTSPPELGTLTGSIINLSFFDKCFAPVPVHLLLVFDQPINDPVQTVKKAVSMALVHYHPMAGRLVAGADDRELIHIACTGQGVSFVHPGPGQYVAAARQGSHPSLPCRLLPPCQAVAADAGDRVRLRRLHGRRDLEPRRGRRRGDGTIPASRRRARPRDASPVRRTDQGRSRRLAPVSPVGGRRRDCWL